jgi:CheY-like chemotaxis protein
VDRAQLIQVLLNLVINARDAMPRGGQLIIATETLEVGMHQLMDRGGLPVEPGAYARLSVRDNGQGIDPEHLSRIFEPFFTTKGVGLGTGLGLATVEGIVSQSGGFVQIESAPGQGTNITILLPLSPAPSKPDIVSETPRTSDTINARILVVDDDEHVRAVVTRLLRSEGYEIIEAANGKEALECVEQAGGGIDLVITDLVMPVMGGREFVEEMHRRYPDIEAIWISGHPRENEFIDSTSALNMPFLQKPIAPNLLLETVQERLRIRFNPRASDRSS